VPDPHLVHVVELIHQRSSRKARRTRTFGQRTLTAATVVLAAASLVLAFAALAAAPFYGYVSFRLPSVEELEVLLDPQTGELLQPTRLYDRNGQTLLVTLEPAGAPRAFIQASDTPLLAGAFIASADPGFLDHGGFLWSISQRPTTLAERLVANLLQADEPPGWLKNLRVRMLAGFATARYGQQQILTWALNSATFGHWTFGVESAAQLYFGKPAADLSLAESALLAAVAQAPALNPFDAPELAIEYQRLVLVAMHEQGLINDRRFATALTEQLEFADAPADDGQATDFAELVVSQLEEDLGPTRIQRGALDVITTLDLVLQQEIEAQAQTASEMVILNPSNLQILALLGEAGATHPSEKMLYSFLYLTAFTQGRSPASLIWDLPETAQSSPDLYHGPISMREALANGYEGAAAALREEMGSVDTSFANLGLSEEKQSVLDLAAGYAIFANAGFGRTLGPSAILFVHDGENLLLDRSQTQANSIISGELAYLVTDILGDASVRSTASLYPDFTRPAAMQIEETAEGSWFVAYTPQRVVTLWAPRQSSDLGSAAFHAAHRDLPIQNWPVPPGLSSTIVCVPSGQLPDADCPTTRREFFLSGNLPATTDMLYERIAVNSLTNTLATVFTPTEFVEERIFTQIPSQAEDWARATGIPMTPTSYDSFPNLDLANAPAAILSPEPFHEVSGTVSILGRMPAETSSYDIQIGKGLYPSDWVLVAQGGRIPSSDRLTEWDTTGLSGLYAIQLQVWDLEGNLFRTYSLVTVIN
jgi:membrane peptidoglycan carboxypeptidase